MRRAVVLLAALLLASLAPPAGAESKEQAAGERTRGSFAPDGLPPRDYSLYVPAEVSARPNKKVPLLVFLHGCNQDADAVADGARLEELADEQGLLVLFPEQKDGKGSTYPLADGNGSRCWNWFLPDHQTRDAGEPATLAAMTRHVMTRFPVDERKVWLGGISAGADMATILAATHPDLYAAVAPIAGCAYRTCSDVDGTAAYAAMGAQARVVPTLVVQGSADMVNNAAMGGTALAQWVATNDLADNGKDDESVPSAPSSVTSHPAVQATSAGDPCLKPSRLPCLGGALGLASYPYTVVRHDGRDGRSVVEALVIHGANHAYTGGDPAGSFVDPVGPDLAHAMFDFFAAHPRPPL